MNGNNKLGGNIDVSMGNWNTVGHIGHVFHRPPPAPNAIIQNGIEVGLVIQGPDPNSITESTAIFGRISHGGAFNVAEPFTIHQSPNVPLKVVRFDAMVIPPAINGIDK